MLLATSSATALAHAIQTNKIGSRDLLETYIARIKANDGPINSIIITDFERARRRANLADEARQKGQNWGPLHGIPLTIKESFEYKGLPTTSGAALFREHISSSNAVSIQRLLDAGAIIMGKSNLPLMTADWQSYNDLYGQTNNPWNLKTTPGGSSGGSAAALAAGFTPLEIGSDIGGSIRTPAHFCGVYGHKPTHGIVPLAGHIPGPPGTASKPDLAVAGPMARSAADLRLMLDVIMGPDEQDAVGWRLELPPARHKLLQDYRVAVWIDDEFCPLDEPVRQQLEAVVVALENVGVRLMMGPPAGFNLKTITQQYETLLSGAMAASLPRAQFDRLKSAPADQRLPNSHNHYPERAATYLNGIVQDHRLWLTTNERRAKLQQACFHLFKDIDILLMPVTPTTAFPHQQEGGFYTRSITVNGQQRSYLDNLPWIGLATMTGLPATSAPVGVATNGMPVNVQLVGPAYGDYTTIHFAQQLATITGGFTPPPGYE